MTIRKNPFYKEGIRFQCQCSSNCCKVGSAYGYVYLSLKEIKAIARYLGQKLETFMRRRIKSHDGEYYFRQNKPACPFLKGKKCGIYPVRPYQCRTWPFWPENLKSRKYFKSLQKMCPGIGRGKLYSPAAINKILGRF